NRKLLAAAAVAVAMLLVLFASPAEASQLNVYEGHGCTGRWTACFDRQCCNVTYTGSYRFYYNDGWPAYIYRGNRACDGSPDLVLRSTVDCTNSFPYQSIRQTDTAP
ncbi:MiAMP1 family antimicrobial peptide, partial [Escherichia coli]|uniref:MiAMP1 family antimicrobial peptide n=1 Tax=Escherichia coli TaxID=562 RepID=UPI00200BF177